MIPREQRAALIAAIRKTFSDVEVEYSKFPWLRVPTIATMDGPLGTIFAGLRRHRGHDAFATEGRKLACDIVIPSERLIVEYDERQHFSLPRAITLRFYPKDMPICFDTTEWIKHCDEISATDNDPPYRDEQRAFYDSTRDILAAANGYRVARLKHGAFDWRPSNANEEVLKLFRHDKPSHFRHDKPSHSFPRFVTVCIEGQPARSYSTHAQRLTLLANVVRQINRRWDNLDVVVFPGGFLRLDRATGQLPYAGRVKALNSAGFVNPIKMAVNALDRSPGAIIVVGVDGPSSDGDGRDQLCIAADNTGIVGIGRKIFPVAEDEANALLCYDADFRDRHRVIQLASGRKAVLCACYDMFGVAERGNVEGKRARLIQNIGTNEDQVKRRTEGFQERLETNLAAFKNLLATENVTVGIAAIHRFPSDPKKGKRFSHSTGLWQRHGIATCSAALGGGFAVGAAHFLELPEKADKSTLSAKEVSKKHLTKAHQRKAESWTPDHHFEQGSALVRLFS